MSGLLFLINLDIERLKICYLTEKIGSLHVCVLKTKQFEEVGKMWALCLAPHAPKPKRLTIVNAGNFANYNDIIKGIRKYLILDFEFRQLYFNSSLDDLLTEISNLMIKNYYTYQNIQQNHQ